ncbi:DUF2510 domain-containing protein [Mycobacterium asiaticum]|uniref:DUF2510 domain-containing protein n=1 Tax=Mycobacterium asiaticum TaxID=1790 RepID=UPI0020A477E9|nr:DUF2510 domain-containing protein [Mycobacterium asiaticum]
MSYPYPHGGGQYHQPQPYQQTGPLYQIGLLKHTGAVIFWYQQSVRFTGTLQQCEQAYRGAQTHCLLAGWWSLGSIVVLKWIALFHNRSAIRRVRSLAQQPQYPQATVPQPPPGATPAGWYPDPSGVPGQRYWDGATWTSFTHAAGPR